MLDGHADGVEEHKDDDEPVELLRLDGVPYPEPEPLLGPPEFHASPLAFHPRLEIGSSREACEAQTDRFSHRSK